MKKTLLLAVVVGVVACFSASRSWAESCLGYETRTWHTHQFAEGFLEHRFPGDSQTVFYIYDLSPPTNIGDLLYWRNGDRGYYARDRRPRHNYHHPRHRQRRGW